MSVSEFQHAAVNFPQKELMSFTPSFPLALYHGAPEKTHHTQKEYMNYLPPLDMAELQLDVAQLLGGTHKVLLYPYN